MRVDVTPSFRELAPIRPGIVPNEQSVFVQEASELLSSLLELEKLLSQVKPKYLLPKRFAERKNTDNHCYEAAVASVKEFRKEVVSYLLERLKCTADSAKQMQKKRYQQPFLLSSRLLPEDDRQGLDSLEKTIVRLRHVGVTKKQIATVLDKNTDAPAIPSSQTSGSPAISTCASSALSVNVPLVEQTTNKPHRDTLNTRNRTASVQVRQPPMFASQSDELELTEEEGRRFAVENVTLHRHFQENLEDAKKMESKMAEISNLMGQFADKIMEQQSDIEQIQHHAYETKSNVSQSNRILEQTQGIGNGYGFMIFCFYAGFSIILHMLHYFNS
uniref:t-SNARE coiled-coil homology domain-containing protein n=1 Tax=Hyaloperonospora arabidopsidis (strain Emoy2) TaxID=559515 RepID=M4BE28_HYAAE